MRTMALEPGTGEARLGRRGFGDGSAGVQSPNMVDSE